MCNPMSSDAELIQNNTLFVCKSCMDVLAYILGFDFKLHCRGHFLLCTFLYVLGKHLHNFSFDLNRLQWLYCSWIRAHKQEWINIVIITTSDTNTTILTRKNCFESCENTLLNIHENTLQHCIF